jgi:hypothetical protein
VILAENKTLHYKRGLTMTRRPTSKEKRLRHAHPHTRHRASKRRPDDTNLIWYSLSKKWFRNAER